MKDFLLLPLILVFTIQRAFHHYGDHRLDLTRQNPIHVYLLSNVMISLKLIASTGWCSEFPFKFCLSDKVRQVWIIQVYMAMAPGRKRCISYSTYWELSLILSMCLVNFDHHHDHEKICISNSGAKA